MAGNREEEHKIFTKFENAITYKGEGLTREQREDATDAAVEKLIKQGLNVNARRKYDGLTPLGTALFQHQLKAFKRLVEAGADLNVKLDSGKTLAEFIDKELYEYEQEKDPDSETDEGYRQRVAEVTPLKAMRDMILDAKTRDLDEATGKKLPADVRKYGVGPFLGGRKSRARRSRKTKRRQTRRRR
jgi:hypothetical protein